MASEGRTAEWAGATMRRGREQMGSGDDEGDGEREAGNIAAQPEEDVD